MSTTKKKKRKPSGHPARINPAAQEAHRRAVLARSRDARRSAVGAWISGARIRTLPLGIAPVALGTGAAMADTDNISKWLVGLCLLVAVFLQIGVNYSNDYSDGVRGTDDYRVGPPRLTGSGLVPPKRVLAVAIVFFALAAASGVAITIITGQYWLLAVGAVAIIAGWFYTGGKHPYGYYGLGELFVFVFFGLVATAGTMYVLAGEVTFEAWASGVAAGCLACAVLVANNIRDIDQDRLVKKRTLTVLIGRTASRILYVFFIVVAYVILGFFALLYPLAPLVFFTLLLALPAVVIMLTGRTAKEFLLVLQLTSILALVYGIGLGLSFGY